jgi:microcystin-dependent protein
MGTNHYHGSDLKGREKTMLNKIIVGLVALLLVASPATAEVYDWSQTPGSNDTSDTASDIQWAEGMAPSDVNDSARAMMTEMRKWIDDLGAYASGSTMQTSAGTSTAYTLTTEGAADNLENGRIVCFLVDETNGASATLNVDSLGAKPIYGDDGALPAGALPINTIQCLSYNAAANGGSGAWSKRNYVPIDGTTLAYDATSGDIKRAALTGDVTASAGSNATSIASAAVTAAKLASDVFTVPVGMVFDFAGSSCPSKSVEAYGQELNDTTYSALLAVIGTTYGAGGASTFNAPDLRGRVTVGEDDMGGVSANRITTTINGDTLAATGGEELHTMTSGELVAHTHGTGTYAVASHNHDAGTYAVGSHNHSADGTLAVASHTHSLTAIATSSDGSHQHTYTDRGDSTITVGSSGNNAADNSSSSYSTGASGSHTHTVTGTSDGTAPDVTGNTSSTTPSFSGSSGSTTPSFSGSSASTGSTTAFNVMQPSIVLRKCIYTGV